MSTHIPHVPDDPITWPRLRAIFNNPPLVHTVTQSQFDGFENELIRLGRTPCEKIEPSDLWYVYHDLAYTELQPDLFAHLFPACLMHWHGTLLANEPCAQGDADFHWGLVHGNILETMLTPEQRDQVESVFCESTLYRLAQERDFGTLAAAQRFHGWLGRINSMAKSLQAIPAMWEEWWQLRSHGHAVSALWFCAEFMYFAGENPLYPPEADVVRISYYDSFAFHRGWSEENIDFARRFITHERIAETISRAARLLADKPAGEIARLVANQIEERRDLIESRTRELPSLLATLEDNWSV